MRRVLVCTGVLGGGTALVFALAGITATLFPQGTLVNSGWNGAVRAFDTGPVPIPAPGMGGGVIVAPIGAGPMRVTVDANGNVAPDVSGARP